MFNNVYAGRRVLITGHTGFKGSWLACWMQKLGADLLGYALNPSTSPSHFDLLKPPIKSVFGDIRDTEMLIRTVKEFRPEIVFHLAAQPLVRQSYQIPAETFAVNVMGTVNVLEACRQCSDIRAAVMVTSDKCYENRERHDPYRETDPLGGFDPYSASKGCAELVTASYRNSFFPASKYNFDHQMLLASARAGNVIGGGDWATDRLVPDLMRAAASGTTEKIRNPLAIRPWQHVLEPLSGYLLLGEKLLEGYIRAASAWNFGPQSADHVTVEETATALAQNWNAVKFTVEPPPSALHEAGILKLDCSKAAEQLNWHGVWNHQKAIEKTSAWYRRYYENGLLNTDDDLEAYLHDANRSNLDWIR
ncbi:MAG: CDP-glucose 4,6-dehydratase [Lentisphaerae bacterium]|nr:CDP-glucose 4,6-dehydratase [Lentisphaerota bacterium]